MDNVIRTPIKELIAKYPEIGTILEEFGIGCVPCGVGTCLLSDIVEIHNLDPEDENILLTRISAVVFPGKAPVFEARKRTAGDKRKEFSYSPPMKRLVDEHSLIKRFIALVPALVGKLDPASEFERQRIIEALDFIRNYADRFHHAKEEEILFGYFDPGLDILKVMHEDHRKGRACVRQAMEALERNDGEGVSANLQAYAEILREHIKKEDEILYPWMDRGLSTRQIRELYSGFSEVDERFEKERKKYESFVINLEKTFSARGAEVLG